MKLREVFVPVLVFFVLTIFLGEKWRQEHEKVEQLELLLEQCEKDIEEAMNDE